MDNNRIHDLERRVQQLEAALQHVIMPTQQVEDTNETNPTASARLRYLNSGIAPVSMHQQYGFWSRPLALSQHTMVNVGGMSGRGISIASNDERYRPLNLLPGDSYMGDNSGQLIWITHGDTINIKTNGTVNITAPTRLQITCPDVEMSGNLTVVGDILDKSTSQAHSVRNMRELYDAHTHPGVARGSGNTDPPDHQE